MDDFWSDFLPFEQQGYEFLTGSPCRLDHYDVRLRIKPDQHSVEVAGTVRGRVIGSEADELKFLLGLDYREPAKTSCTIREFLLNGHPTTIQSDKHMHRVAFPRRHHKGETFEISFSYSGVPVARKCWVNAQSDWPIPGLADGETELCFEGYWLPFANALFQAVTYELDIADLPGTVIVVNGESLGGRDTNGEVWHQYRSTAVTFPTVIAGNFEIQSKSINSGAFSFYHQAGYAEVADEVLETGIRILNLFTQWLKISPKGDLALIQLARTEWGQYAPFPLVIFPRDDIKMDLTANNWKKISQMLAHEIGHFWFGNLLRSSPTEQWLSEGFAQYFNLLYTEYAFGMEALNSEIEHYVSGLATIDIESQAPLTHITLDHPKQFILVRIKGAVVLHCLRQRLGFDQFIELLRTLVRTYQQQTITTHIVEEVVVKFLGSQETRSFFDLHLRGLASYTWYPETGVVKASSSEE